VRRRITCGVLTEGKSIQMGSKELKIISFTQHRHLLISRKAFRIGGGYEKSVLAEGLGGN
jgi:hypothetical protein